MTKAGFAGTLADALETSWPAQARANQLPPPSDWNVWLLLAGRGFGKTRTLAEWANAQAVSGQAARLAIVAATAADARDVLVEGESGILACAPSWARPSYESSRRRVMWPNGAIEPFIPRRSRIGCVARNMTGQFATSWAPGRTKR
jgi:phage terminase large subunit-like protein